MHSLRPIESTSKKLKKELTDLKNKRNALTDSVRSMKKERDELNKQLRESIAAIKKSAPAQKGGKRGPSRGMIKKQIEQLEYKIETEALSPKKEQEMMKLIKEKKKEMGDGPGEKVRSKEIDNIRKKADDMHAKTKTKADESQKIHEEVISVSNKLKGLQNTQNKLDAKCKEYKEKVRVVNEKLKSSLEKHVSSVRPGKRDRPAQKKAKKSIRDKNIAQKQKIAEEKLKTGKTLTTEDILAMQAKK